MRPNIQLLSARAPQNIKKVPFQPILPMALRNKVSGKYDKQTEGGCLYEISLLFACMQKNAFDESLCSHEINNLNVCYSDYLSKRRTRKADQEKGIITPGEKNLTHLQLNKFLKRFPNV
ncbi:uncharacterized protein LOC107267376 [Cephus cinctus]|uniref:Uncharacterized protein LOC107267376 n=1 Tax=Cephus cinctus TaxID=211228 RepID=A0AAJ7RHE7_CEPCN|nr:uncharacterized protein LOC107267376 [Cephus cinctus]